jgi:hypothetical protein
MAPKSNQQISDREDVKARLSDLQTRSSVHRFIIMLTIHPADKMARFIVATKRHAFASTCASHPPVISVSSERSTETILYCAGSDYVIGYDSGPNVDTKSVLEYMQVEWAHVSTVNKGTEMLACDHWRNWNTALQDASLHRV